MAPITLLQIVPKLNAGGAERTTLEIARANIERGGRSLVAAHGGSMLQQLQEIGATLFDLPVHSKNPATVYANIDRLAALARNKNVELIHARSRAPAWSARAAARRLGLPYVATHHGAYRAESFLKRGYSHAITSADRVIANSKFTARAMVNGGVETSRIRIIPRGVDVEKFNPAQVAHARVQSLEAAWGLKENQQSVEFRCLLPARLTSWKGHKVAIDAAAKLKFEAAYGQAPKMALVFCGGAQDKQQYTQGLREYVVERGVADMVRIVGECADMAAAYQWSDIVLTPSTKPEPFGRVAIEAGAMEKPVIASDHGGACETVINGQTGFLVAPDSASALADNIFQLSRQSDSERADIGRRARARIIEQFSQDSMCAATMSVYDELIGSR